MGAWIPENLRQPRHKLSERSVVELEDDTDVLTGCCQWQTNVATGSQTGEVADMRQAQINTIWGWTIAGNGMKAQWALPGSGAHAQAGAACAAFHQAALVLLWW